jgi:hypothetical protein
MKLGSIYYGFVKDGKVVMINVAGVIKPNVDKYAVWQKILDAITFGGAAAPTTPPVAAPAATPLSFEAATYTNDANGVTMQYPKSWVKVDLAPDVIFRVAASTAQGADLVGVTVIPEAADFGKAMKDAFDNDPVLKSLGVKMNVDSSKATTLADGKTPANEAIVSAKIMGMDLYGYCFGINKGGKTIAVTGATLAGDKNKALMKEIAQTLAAK